jgi:hypothetical protein
VDGDVNGEHEVRMQCPSRPNHFADVPEIALYEKLAVKETAHRFGNTPMPT